MRVGIIRFADRAIGNAMCRLLGIFASSKGIRRFQTVLFIQLWGVGETVLTLPAITALARKHPKARISVLCTRRNKDVYSGLDFIHEIHVLGMNPMSILRYALANLRRYDLAIDFEEYLNISAIIAFFAGRRRIGYADQVRSRLYSESTRYNDMQHVVETHLDLVRLVGADDAPKNLVQLWVSDEDKRSVDKLLSKLKISRNTDFIGICVGAAESARSRMWPEVRFARLADRLIEKYKMKIVFVGSEKERRKIIRIISLMGYNAANTAGMTTLKQSFYLISRARMFISNDTGPMHVAAAMDVPTIGLFGPNLPVRWGPFGPKNLSIYKENVCSRSPCINVHLGEVPECFHGKDNKCMRAIEIDDVIKCTDKILDGRKA